MRWSSKCCPWMSSIRNTWELARTTKVNAHLTPTELKTPGVEPSNLSFNSPSRWLWSMLKFEKHWSKRIQTIQVKQKCNFQNVFGLLSKFLLGFFLVGPFWSGSHDFPPKSAMNPYSDWWCLMPQCYHWELWNDQALVHPLQRTQRGWAMSLATGTYMSLWWSKDPLLKKSMKLKVRKSVYPILEYRHGREQSPADLTRHTGVSLI